MTFRCYSSWCNENVGHRLIPDLCDDPAEFWLDLRHGYTTLGQGHLYDFSTIIAPKRKHNEDGSDDFTSARVDLLYDAGPVGSILELVFIDTGIAILNTNINHFH